MKSPLPKGQGIDSSGGPVVDPTANVLALVSAAISRQDDLREETNKRYDSELRHLREMATLRAQNGDEIRKLESDRLDKIRQVDVLAGNTAADRALIAIQTLAQSNTTTADTLRAMVDNTAKTIAAQTESAMKGVNERLVMLERSLYEGKGKQTVSDPMMEKLVQRMDSLLESRAATVGKSAGLSLGTSILLGSLGLIGTVLGIVAYFAK